MAAPASNPYFRTKVLTASPQELRLMLYDGALKFCRQAKPALENKRFEESYNNLMRAQHIVMELSNGLNPQVNPELCERLSALYTYLYRRLVEANIEREVAIIDEVIEVLEYERETWQLLMQRHAEQNGQSSADHTAPRTPQPQGAAPAASRFFQSA